MLERPVLLWLLFLIIVTAMGAAAKASAPGLLAGPAGVGPLQVALQFTMLLMVAPFALRLGSRQLGLGTPGIRGSGPILLFPALTVAIGYLGGFREVSWPLLSLALVSVALAGLAEELAFRGVLLARLLEDRGVWAAVLLSSAMFGLMHLANLALGAPWQTTLLQITFAAMAGTGYAAMRLRTGSLWPPILLHALYDLTYRVGLIESGSVFANLIHMLHGVGWAAYALIVLRRRRRAGSGPDQHGRECEKRRERHGLAKKNGGD